MAEGWVYIAEEWRWTGAGPAPAHQPDCHINGCTTDCPPYVEPTPIVDVPCPHDPTGTSPYACACEDG